MEQEPDKVVEVKVIDYPKFEEDEEEESLVNYLDTLRDQGLVLEELKDRVCECFEFPEDKTDLCLEILFIVLQEIEDQKAAVVCAELAYKTAYGNKKH